MRYTDNLTVIHALNLIDVDGARGLSLVKQLKVVGNECRYLAEYRRIIRIDLQCVRIVMGDTVKVVWSVERLQRGQGTNFEVGGLPLFGVVRKDLYVFVSVSARMLVIKAESLNFYRDLKLS